MKPAVNKLSFNKSTIAKLDDSQLSILGGAAAASFSCNLQIHFHFGKA